MHRSVSQCSKTTVLSAHVHGSKQNLITKEGRLLESGQKAYGRPMEASDSHNWKGCKLCSLYYKSERALNPVTLPYCTIRSGWCVNERGGSRVMDGASRLLCVYVSEYCMCVFCEGCTTPKFCIAALAMLYNN